MLDADVVIQGEKGAFDFNAWLARHTNERFELAAITVAELWHGVERATPRRRTAIEGKDGRGKPRRAGWRPLPLDVTGDC
jgi:hypothetical protein